MDFTMTNEKGEGISFLRIPYDMDIDIGNTNDYELNVSLSEWQAAGYKAGCRFFVPWHRIWRNYPKYSDGGRQPMPMTVSGDIWRGSLRKKSLSRRPGPRLQKSVGRGKCHSEKLNRWTIRKSF